MFATYFVLTSHHTELSEHLIIQCNDQIKEIQDLSTNRTKSLKSQMASKDHLISELESEITELKSNLTSYINKLTSQKSTYLTSQLHLNTTFTKHINSLKSHLSTYKSLNSTQTTHLQTLNSKISTLEQTLTTKEDQIRKYEKYEDLKKTKIGIYTVQEFNELTTQIVGKNMWNNSKVVIKLKEEKHLEVLERMDKKMPNLDRLRISNSGDIRIFLRYFFPDKVKEFHFNLESNKTSLLSYYLDELETIAPKIHSHMTLYNFKIDQSTLTTLLSYTKHIPSLGFHNCEFSIPSVLDFGTLLDGSRMKVLKFGYIRESFFSEEGEKQSHFENLVQGLSRSEDVKKSLDTFWVSHCGVSQEKVNLILAKYR